MRVIGIILAVAVALALQTTVSRFVVRSTVALDLVLVVLTPTPARAASEGASE